MISPYYRPRKSAAFLTLVIALAGCQAPSQQVDPVADIQSATGMGLAVAMQTEGESLDVLEEHDKLMFGNATRQAIQHSPELQAALARVRAAQADARQTRLLPNPILNVAVRFPTSGGGDPIIEAGLAADLISVLQKPTRSRAADARLRVSSAESLSTALDVISEVQTSYTAVQALEAELNVLDERKQLINRLLGLAKNRVELGESSQLDVLTLRSEQVALDVEIAEKRTERRSRRLELARLIGQPSSAAKWELPKFDISHDVPVDEAAWIEHALKHRPEIQSRRWELEALRSEATLAGWAVLDGGDVGVAAEDDDGWTIGPAISTPIPIFDWGQDRRAKAQAEVIEARHKSVQTRRLIVQEVRQAFESLTSSQSALAIVQDVLLPLQQQRIAQAEMAYRNGLADITGVLIAEQESQASRQKMIELQQKAAEALYQLHRVVGGIGNADSLPTTRPSRPATAPATRMTP